MQEQRQEYRYRLGHTPKRISLGPCPVPILWISSLHLHSVVTASLLLSLSLIHQLFSINVGPKYYFRCMSCVAKRRTSDPRPLLTSQEISRMINGNPLRYWCHFALHFCVHIIIQNCCYDTLCPLLVLYVPQIIIRELLITCLCAFQISIEHH